MNGVIGVARGGYYSASYGHAKDCRSGRRRDDFNRWKTTTIL